MVGIKINDLRDLCTTALLKTGLSQTDVDVTVDHYLENECMGKASHGMVRVLQVFDTAKKNGIPQNKPEIQIDKGNQVAINGNMNFGPIVGKTVLDESIKRTKKHGISLVGANHYMTTSGSMAYYLRRLTKEGLIGFMSCSSESMVTAPAGKERFIGTNPIGLGIPSETNEHFIADFATSAITHGEIIVANDKQKTLPMDCIIDKGGLPSTDPQDAVVDGAILPLTDYRGFALGLFIELISLMFGIDIPPTSSYGKNAIFIIAIDPSKLSDGYAERVSNILNYIRNSPPAPGHDSVSIPGDRSAKTLKETLARGTVDVADKTLEKIKDLAT